MFDKFVEDHPGKSDEELKKLSRKELEDYFDFNDSTSRVFIVKKDDGTRCGYLWMGLRNSEDPWDIQRPQWIYDIVVAPEFYGNGLGKMLMRTAEEFSTDLNLNIGLFVHADNEHAIALYDRVGYRTKVVPISKKLDEEIIEPVSSSKFLIREQQMVDEVRCFELERFKRKVLFSLYADKEKIEDMYEEYVEDSESHLRLEAVTKDNTLVGSIWAGVSRFDENVAQIYNISILSQSFGDDLWNALIYSTEKWARDSGYSRLYVLLHSQDDLDIEAFRALEYSIPGFFMEKKLTQ
jgi:GNAT superfamily N-acetyltransferase